MRAAPGSLQAAALEAILEVAAGAPAEFAGESRSKTSWLQGFLSHVNPAGEPSCETHKLKKLGAASCCLMSPTHLWIVGLPCTQYTGSAMLESNLLILSTVILSRSNLPCHVDH